jgi:site-specific recombinase XerD
MSGNLREGEAHPARMAGRSGDLAAERELLVLAARTYAEASLAESTRRAYRSDFEDFSLWCHHRQLVSLPATSETICLYLTDLAQRGRAVPTLERRVAALKLAHRTAGVEPSPTEDVAVRQVMRGIRRTIGIAPRRQAAPLVIQQLRVLLAANPDESLQDVQDYALLLLGFAFAGRASDLVSLDVADLEFTDRGLLIHLRKSKTDQEMAGEVVGVPVGQHQETDPILAVKRWLSLSELTMGPLWRGVDRWGNLYSERLSTRGVTRAIRRAAARTEMDAEHLSSHSLRAGFATSAAAAGASERSIAAQTRHRSMQTLRRYIRMATAFDENAVSKVGL